jgi:hypothetical protein
MMPHLPVMPCKQCDDVTRPHLTTAANGTYIAHCASCGARIKAIPSLTMAEGGQARRAPLQGTVVHPLLLAKRCRHCGEIDVPHLGPGRGPHAGAAHCPHCEGFLAWVPKAVMAQMQGESMP